MDFVKLTYNGYSYDYNDSSSLKMYILSRFLSNDVGYRGSSFIEWATNPSDISTCSNFTGLEKDNEYVYLSDLYSEENEPTQLKIPLKEFIKLVDLWEKQVCKFWPKEVLIKHENDQFVIETKN